MVVVWVTLVEQRGDQAACFGHGHRDELLFLCSGAPFWCSPARMAASQARASIDRVMWAYQPRKVRT